MTGRRPAPLNGTAAACRPDFACEAYPSLKPWPFSIVTIGNLTMVSLASHTLSVSKDLDTTRKEGAVLVDTHTLSGKGYRNHKQRQLLPAS